MFDWGQIPIVAAAGAVVGGAAGGLLGALAGQIATRARVAAAVLLAAAGGAAGYSLAPTSLEPIFAETSPALTAPGVSEAEVLEELREQPILDAILDRRPDLEADLARRVAERVRDGDQEALFNESLKWGNEHVTGIFLELAPYARERDLAAWTRGTADLLKVLLADDPFTCHDFLFGLQNGHPIASDALTSEFGAAVLVFSNDTLAPLIREANPDAAFKTSAEDAARFQQLAEDFVTDLGMERIVYIQGARPETKDEARIVCEAMVRLYDHIADQPRAGAIARLMLEQTQ